MSIFFFQYVSAGVLPFCLFVYLPSVDAGGWLATMSEKSFFILILVHTLFLLCLSMLLLTVAIDLNPLSDSASFLL